MIINKKKKCNYVATKSCEKESKCKKINKWRNKFVIM